MRARADAHPGTEALRALLDGELRWIVAVRCRRHLRRCPACAAELAGLRSDRDAAEVLLGRLGRGVDVDEAWARLAAVAGARLGPRRSPLAFPLVGLGLAAAAVLLVVGVRARGEHGDAQAATLSDRCCWDLDGGGPGDDGIVAVTLPGQRVVGLTLYEDTNGSGSLSASDRIRFGIVEAMLSMTRAEAESDPAARESAIVRDFCCADHDGGGHADDGVFTVNRAGEVVDHVVLYEDADGDGRFSAPDVVMWVGGLSPGAAPGEPPPR